MGKCAWSIQTVFTMLRKFTHSTGGAQNQTRIDSLELLWGVLYSI